MKKHLVLSTMLISLAAMPAFAQQPAAAAPAAVAPVTSPTAIPETVAAPVQTPAAAPAGTYHHEVTLDQARERAHKHADKLDKMSPDQFAAEKAKRRERREKWQHMTPQERDAAKKAAHEKWTATHHNGSLLPTSPAAAPASGGQ